MADAGAAQQGATEGDVAQFVALTGSSTDTAAFMLEATHGNLEQAVQMYLGEPRRTPHSPTHSTL